MDKASKRGKIPQSDWPLIMARYEAGETLASIARTYDCSPPAISYVVSRSRARQRGPDAAQPANGPELQLIKAPAADGRRNGSGDGHAHAASEGATNGRPAPATPNGTEVPPTAAPIVAPPPHGSGSDNLLRSYDKSGRRNGVDHGAEASALRPADGQGTRQAVDGTHSGSGDQRRRLHLSLGGRTATTDSAPTSAASAPAASSPSDPNADRRLSPSVSLRDEAPHTASVANIVATNGAPASQPSAADNGAGRDAAARMDRPTGNSNSNSAFIDRELRARVDGDIAAFLEAFDAALLQDTQASRAALREATDRLLRAGARTRIELERLEARMPLPPRDNVRRGELAWRYR